MPADDLTVSGSSDPSDGPAGDAVTFGGVSPVVGRAGLVAGLVALLVGFVVVAVRRPDPTGFLRAGPAPAVAPPVAPDSALPADVVFAGPAGTPVVLVDRAGAPTPLPAGVAVAAAVKVPSGWVVAAGGRVLHVRGNAVTDLGAGTFFVDATGTRAVVSVGPAVSVFALPGDVAEATTTLPAGVRVLGWLGPAVLVGADDGHLDRWTPGRPYAETPGFFTGNVLGTSSDALVVHRREGTLDCIVYVPDLHRPDQEYRCGFDVPVDGAALEAGWPGVAPGGAYAAMPGPDRSAHFASLPAMLDGRATFAPATGLPGAVRSFTWRDGVTAAVLVDGDDTHVWTCAAAAGGCRATPVTGPAGLRPARLAARLPAGG